VVLFDIDGTLISTGGAGARSWGRAFRKLHDREADITAFSESGMTDPVVGRAVFEGVLGRQPNQQELSRLIMAYLMELPIEVANSPTYHRFDGVIRTLERLSEAGTLLGLVTGNIEGALGSNRPGQPQSLLRSDTAPTADRAEQPSRRAPGDAGIGRTIDDRR
jgi:phosphoglycolate phosphatase-like HAD superfamily hydrolase